MHTLTAKDMVHGKGTMFTLSVWPVMVWSGTAARMSHSFTVESCEAVARWCTDCGCHAIAAIQSVWLLSVLTACIGESAVMHGSSSTALVAQAADWL